VQIGTRRIDAELDVERAAEFDARTEFVARFDVFESVEQIVYVSESSVQKATILRRGGGCLWECGTIPGAGDRPLGCARLR
jgi:hypothetical protein